MAALAVLVIAYIALPLGALATLWLLIRRTTVLSQKAKEMSTSGAHPDPMPLGED